MLWICKHLFKAQYWQLHVESKLLARIQMVWLLNYKCQAKTTRLKVCYLHAQKGKVSNLFSWWNLMLPLVQVIKILVA